MDGGAHEALDSDALDRGPRTGGMKAWAGQPVPGVGRGLKL